MSNKYKVKEFNPQSSLVTTIILINIFVYALVIFLSLFTVSFDITKLLPRYEVWTKLPLDQQGFWPWEKGIIEVVPKGTPGAYLQPNVLVISAVIQTLGFFLYLNTRFGAKLKLTLEKNYLRNIKIINRHKYLVSDVDFRRQIDELDIRNKKDAYRLLAQEALQKFSDKMPKSVMNEFSWPVEKQSKKTIKWFAKEKELKQHLDEAWISENIYRMKFRYPKINVRLIISGQIDIELERLAITDVKQVEQRETKNKLTFAILSFAGVVILTSFGMPAFRSDIWLLIKDFVVYASALVLNIIMGNISANVIHEARIRQTEDRLGYISGYVGKDAYKAVEQQIDKDEKLFNLEMLQAELKLKEAE